MNSNNNSSLINFLQQYWLDKVPLKAGFKVRRVPLNNGIRTNLDNALIQ